MRNILEKLCRENQNTFYLLDVHGSVHRDINLTERTNKMQPCSRIYNFNVS